MLIGLFRGLFLAVLRLMLQLLMLHLCTGFLQEVLVVRDSVVQKGLSAGMRGRRESLCAFKGELFYILGILCFEKRLYGSCCFE